MLNFKIRILGFLLEGKEGRKKENKGFVCEMTNKTLSQKSRDKQEGKV